MQDDQSSNVELPQHWADFSALTREPLKTFFVVTRYQLKESRAARRGEDRLSSLVRLLLDDPGACEIATAWLKICFPLSSPQEQETNCLNQKSMLIFAHAFWLAFEKTANCDIITYIDKERKKMGFQYKLNAQPCATDLLITKRNPPENSPTCKSEPMDDNFLRKRALSETEQPLNKKSKPVIPKNQNPKRKRKRKRRRGPKSQLEPGAGQLAPPSNTEHHGQAEMQSTHVDTSQNDTTILPAVTVERLPIDSMAPPSELQGRPPALVQPLLKLANAEPIAEDTEAGEPISNWITDTHFLPEHEAPCSDTLHSADDQILSAMPCLSEAKSPLQRLPPIWAVSRQEVCESFDWFRSYQGGVYHANGFAKGYLLSAYAASRDLFHHEGRLIISHGGGKWESQHMNRGQTETHLADDQLAQDKSVRALISNYRNQRPLALLIDDKYALFPFNLSAMGVTYAVLGFFFVTKVWAEYQTAINERGRVVRYKFAFQWCQAQGRPWWLIEDGPTMFASTLNGNANSSREEGLHNFSRMQRSVSTLQLSGERADASTLHVFPWPTTVIQEPCKAVMALPVTCMQCRTDSPRVYQKWMCLNPECQHFWHDLTGQIPSDGDLVYNEEFLELVSDPRFPYHSGDLLPRQPDFCPKTGITTDYAYTRGWHCSKCGRLACRSKWEQWDCPRCRSSLKIVGRVRKASEFRAIKLTVNFYDHTIVKGSGIKQHPLVTFRLDCGRGHYQVFELPQDRGRVILIQGGLPFGNRDADRIFEEYQEEAATGALPFRRWPLRAHKLRGPMLTHYFSQNAGAPYQYVGGADNTLPFDQARVVARARDLIQTRLHQALNVQAEFNEVLSCAYMCKQKMAFHSDAEKGLGPLIAGLSLGSPALMHFRPCSKFEPDVNKRGIILSLVLRHGDILVMDGSCIQKYYEHTVIPVNFRIAATARLISPENAKDSSVTRGLKLEAQ